MSSDIASTTIDKLRRENEEQARLLAGVAERETRLLGKIGELQHQNAALRAASVEACALARVWVTIWHDKLSDESVQLFTQLEKKILREVQP